MKLGEVDIRIDYFHRASDQHLRMLGVDRSLLPTPDAWRASYEEDFARPLRARANYLLVLERGFRYLFSHETTPGSINFPQLATRWVLDRLPGTQ